MTHAELFRAALEMVNAAGYTDEHLCVSVEIKRYSHQREPEIKFSIYLANVSPGFIATSQSPEDCLAALRIELERDNHG